MKVVALVGMAGAGKSEAVNYLEAKTGWPKVYFGEVTFDRMRAEGLEINSKNEKQTREKIRQYPRYEQKTSEFLKEISQINL